MPKNKKQKIFDFRLILPDRITYTFSQHSNIVSEINHLNSSNLNDSQLAKLEKRNPLMLLS